VDEARKVRRKSYHARSVLCIMFAPTRPFLRMRAKQKQKKKGKEGQSSVKSVRSIK